MKKIILPCLLCVFFFLLSTNIGIVFAFCSQKIEFVYQDKVFTYNLEKNLKTSNIFDFKYEMNKYNRFGSNTDRVSLLKKMLKLNIDKEIALEYLFPNLNKTIDSISKNIQIKPKDAKLKIDSNSQNVFQISEEVVGIRVNKQQLIDNVCSNFISSKDMLFEIPITKIFPQITKSQLEKQTNLRSNYSTNISSSSIDRKHNIKNALMALNKVEIFPNEVFSFNKTIGKRTVENGYRQAKIIVNNEFVDGIGGGVCQVSSTLYNSALLAGLEIIEANKHSRQVSYVKQGFDAMVNFGSSDLKFRNNTNEKLYIITNYSNATAKIRIYGEHMGNTKFKLTNEIFNSIEPIEEIIFDTDKKFVDKVYYEDEFFFLKSPSRGVEIKSFREKYVDNTLVSTEFLRHDKFKVQNGIKVYGTNQRLGNEKNPAQCWTFLF